MKIYSSNEDLEVHEILTDFDQLGKVTASEQWNQTLLQKISTQQRGKQTKINYKLLMGVIVIIFINAGMILKITHNHPSINSGRQQHLEMIAFSLMIPSNN